MLHSGAKYIRSVNVLTASAFSSIVSCRIMVADKVRCEGMKRLEMRSRDGLGHVKKQLKR